MADGGSQAARRLRIVDVPLPEPTPCWVSSGGQWVPVPEMDTQHLVNSIHKINRTDWRQEWRDTLIAEMETRMRADVIRAWAEVNRRENRLHSMRLRDARYAQMDGLDVDGCHSMLRQRRY